METAVKTQGNRYQSQIGLQERSRTLDPPQPARKIIMLKTVISLTCLFCYADSKLAPIKNEGNQLLTDVPIEGKSWFDSQTSGSSFSQAYDHLGDIMVFDGGTWNPYPTCKSCGKFQNYQTACPNKGEYLNLCGECVGGSSEKDDDFGLDSCGICGGLERCGLAGCGDDLDDDIETTTNCTKMVGIRPKVIDMASSEKGLIHLLGDVDKKNVLCNANSGTSDLGHVEVMESPEGLTFEFQLPVREGRVDLHCNSTKGFGLMNSLLVVDSRKLQPLTSDVKHINFGKESQVALTVGNMYALADLVCFAKDDSGTVVYKAWSNDIQGNTLSSKVVCSRIWPQKAGNLKFGVAYSEESISLVKTVDINVVAKDLILQNAILSNSMLMIQFDQAVLPSTKCEEMFKTISNKVAECRSAGNEIRVRFNGSPKMKTGETLEVRAASASTGVVESFSVKLDGEMLQALSTLEINGPDTVCSGQEASFDVNASGASWNLALQNTTEDMSLTPGNRQRKIMLMWQRLRQAQKSMTNGGSDNRVKINTTLLSPGVDYQVKATLPNGKARPVTIAKNFKIVTNEATQPIIRGPSSFSWTNNALYEVDNPMCGTQPPDLMYEWSIGDQNQSLVHQMGPKIQLRGGLLKSSTKYNLRVRVLNNTDVINEVAMEVTTQPAELSVATYMDEVVYGTGHDIVLQGNPDVVSSMVESAKYKWSCTSEMGPCAMPGKDRKPVDTLRGFDDSILVIPAGSLPVGKYTFSLQVSLPSGESTEKSVHILVVSGEPTVLMLDSVKVDDNLQLTMTAKDIIGTCDVYLESLRTVNTSYVEPKDLIEPVKAKGTPHSPGSETLNLKIPSDGLIFGTSYKFRLTADCGALSQSWMTFTVPVPGKSTLCGLKVTPEGGSALTTEFKFEATDCHPTSPIYSYGFAREGATYVVVSSLTPNQKIFSLPGDVRPMMKICEPGKTCTIYLGNNLTVQEASTIESSAVLSVLKLYSDNLITGHFEEAAGASRLLLESTKNEHEVHKNVSNSITEILLERIKEVSKQYDADSHAAPEALQLLECATEIVKGVASPDEAINAILEFRDQIENLTKRSEDSNLAETSRRKRSIKKRQADPTTVSKVTTLLKTYEMVANTSKDSKMITAEMDKMLRKMPLNVISLCNAMKRTARPAEIDTSIVRIDVLRLEQAKKVNRTIPECSANCDNSSSVQVILNKPFIDKLNTTEGICLSINYFKEDYYSMTRNATSETNIGRWSGVYTSHLYKYKGDKIQATDESANKTSTAMGTIRIPIFNIPAAPRSRLTCHLWKDEFGWNENPCTTVQRTTVVNVPALECRCPFPGVYAIFDVDTRMENGTTKLPESSDTTASTTPRPAPPETTTALPAPTLAARPKSEPTTPKQPTTTAKTTPVTNTTTTTPITTSKTVVTNGTGAVPPHDPTAGITTSAPITPNLTTTVLTTTVAPTFKPQDYKMAASFMINEKYNETVGSKKVEFEDKLKSQLAKTVNIPELTKVDAFDNHESIKVIVRMRSSDRADIPLLQKLLNNGTLKLLGLNNTQLNVPKQNLVLDLPREGRSSTFAVISSAIFITVAFLLAILLSGMFLKWKRQQRALSFVQNMEVSAPKYLRLQETTSMDRISRGYGSTENLRSGGDLDSGIVLTVDPTRISSKYRPAESSRNTVA